MSLKAWAYVCSVIVAGFTITFLAIPDAPLPRAQWETFAILTSLAVATQLLEAKFGKSTYYPHTVFFFAGVILLRPIQFILLIIIPHLAEWFQKRLSNSPYLRDWYLQPFNISVHILSGIAAQIALETIDSSLVMNSSALELAGALTGAVAYVLVNHLMVGQALVLARGVSWKKSGVMSMENVSSELILLLLGYVAAELWQQQMWLAVPALAPLVLVYKAMMVPQLRKEAQTDQKTGLLNSRHFDERFQDEFRRAQRFERPISLIMADLDLLRDINNNYGHLAGDAVIVGIAEIFRQEVRDYDITGRFGGEEFAIALPETDEETAWQVADRLRTVIENSEFRVSSQKEPIRATMSFGVASFPEAAASPEDLIYEADVALYQAKFQGRNRAIRSSEVPHSVRLEMEQTQHGSQAAQHAPPCTQPSAGAVADQQFDQTNAERQRVSRQHVVRGTHLSVSPASGKRSAAGTANQTDSPDTSADNVHGKSSPNTEQQPMPFKKKVFLALTIIAGAALAGLGTQLAGSLDLVALGILALLVCGAELLQLRVYENSTVSVSVAFIVAASVLAGLPGAALISGAITLFNLARKRPALYRAAFNWSIHVIACTGPASLYYLLRADMMPNRIPILLVAAGVVTAIMFLVESMLVAGAIALSTNEDIFERWHKQFRWLAPHYLILGIIGLLITIAYNALGVMGIVVFSLPALMMYFSQKLYIERTQDSFQELERMNRELYRANQEVNHANEAIHQLNDELFLTLSKIIDVRDPHVSGHALQVATYARAVTEEMGLPIEQRQRIQQAALLHDIGKIGVPDSILQKAEELETEEYEQVKRHSEIGAEFLETVAALRHLAPAVRQHHEHWDGSGYPQGLQREEIPLEARVLAVCDAVEAMASDRPYHAAMTPQEVVAELRRCMGTQFDPEVCVAFFRVMEKQGDGFIVNTTRRSDEIIFPNGYPATTRYGASPGIRQQRKLETEPILP